MRKKILVSLLVASCVLSGCKKDTKSIYNEGLNVIAIMDEIANSDSYNEAMTPGDSLDETIMKLREGDYDTVTSVYQITFSEDMAIKNIAPEYGFSLDDLSEQTLKHLDQKMMKNLVYQICGNSGSTALATASLYSVDKTFVSNDINKVTMYIYAFETGYPVGVTFIPGEDDSVTASGSFLIVDDYVNSVEGTKNLFGMLADGIKVEKIK